MTVSAQNIDDWSAFAVTLADAASAQIMPFFRANADVENKLDGGKFDPVTEADRNAELSMRALIKARYPDHGIIGEEFGAENTDADCVWILDPIDGTKAFITGFPLWGTLIGLVCNAIPVVGVMNQPFTAERFIGAGGKSHGVHAGKTRQLQTRMTTTLDTAVLTTTSPLLIAETPDLVRFEALQAKVQLTRYGGDCYGYCMLAAGQTDLVVETGLNSYDIAPLIPIIEGAGGIVTDWRGGSAAAGGRIIAAANTDIHRAALGVLNAT